ncbi:Dolichol-phosphate mannosyltransferase in lipid-linked oligosaccharide synthesis cluster [plant metagenome]|uniref:Dolichol-phosphate mannosyltransferase in lipid-linked oligosaccharide synthesis cluster n=1 Tax=plant metagenome TaxID=1297885 RepID=A0A484P822_9ZZZZ
MGHAYLFTVFTPTFNRAHTLGRVYASLRAQTCTDFEWLIVDDGSTDGTEALVRGWMAEAPFPLRYLTQDHGHKKAAFNRGVREANGELFVALDSDDEMPADALAILAQAWEAIEPSARARYSAITGLCARPDGTVVGDAYPSDVFDSSPIDMYFRHDVHGEKFGFQRTDVLARFPFPEHIQGFVPESLVWWAIAREGYATRFINRVVRYYHDTPGALSGESARSNAPGLYLLANELLARYLDWFRWRPREFLLAAARRTRFGLHLGAQGRRAASPQGLSGIKAWALVCLMWPLGVALYLRDRLRGG